MDALKMAIAAKRKATEEAFQGRKYVKKGELERLRLQKLREEEEREREEKEAKRRAQQGGGASGAVAADADAAKALAAAPPAPVQALSREEAIRRLRVLKQPATLFGETDEQRLLRLAQAERDVQIEDEAAGGQQANVALEIQRGDRQRKKAPPPPPEKSKPRAPGPDAPADGADADGRTAGGELAAVDPAQARLEAAFKAAAEEVAERQLPLEDRLARRLRRWVADWEADLEARPQELKDSPAGYQATVRFRETVQFMRPLFARLKSRQIDPELLAGIKLIVDALKQRNYLQAYEIYMGISIGNSPWPIGVTQVGLHERAAREKISFKGASGTAHIMNDEATRKYIQALKRLMTFVQRAYPTDPSRSVDFDGFSGGGRGAAGGGSDKKALLDALARGEEVAPAPAPTHADASGQIKVPAKWEHTIRAALAEVHASDAAEEEEERTAAADKAAQKERAAAAAGEAAAAGVAG